jgi:hypothetical protein
LIGDDRTAGLSTISAMLDAPQRKPKNDRIAKITTINPTM